MERDCLATPSPSSSVGLVRAKILSRLNTPSINLMECDQDLAQAYRAVYAAEAVVVAVTGTEQQRETTVVVEGSQAE